MTFFRTSPATKRHHYMRTCIIAVGLGVAVSGCVQPRMDATFNSESFGAPPQYPSPTPPSDSLTWQTNGYVRSTLVQDSSGGGHIRIEPLPAYFTNVPRVRLVMYGVSEGFTYGRHVNMKGTVRIRINGTGNLFFLIRAIQSGEETGWIGGGVVHAVRGPGSAISLGSAISVAYPVTDNYFDVATHQPEGPWLAPYFNGRRVTFYWSIDQSEQIFNLTAEGATHSYNFSLRDKSPITRLTIWLGMNDPDPGMVAHVDDITMDELN